MDPSKANQRGGPLRHRVLIGKPGLDGHDRGAKYVARVLRDAGFEVIYTGIRRTPEELVAAAIQEDVRAIGISLLSGAHNNLVARVATLLEERGVSDVVLFVGGIIPDHDVPTLEAMGVAAVFGPGTPAATIVAKLRESLEAPPGGAQEPEPSLS